VQPGPDFARRKESGHRRHLRITIDANAAHHVVGGRTDFHRLLGDVDVRQLLELVIHAGELFLDVLLGVGELRSDPRDVQENTAVWAASSLAHFFDDRTRDVVAGE